MSYKLFSRNNHEHRQEMIYLFHFIQDGYSSQAESILGALSNDVSARGDEKSDKRMLTHIPLYIVVLQL